MLEHLAAIEADAGHAANSELHSQHVARFAAGETSIDAPDVLSLARKAIGLVLECRKPERNYTRFRVSDSKNSFRKSMHCSLKFL